MIQIRTVCGACMREINPPFVCEYIVLLITQNVVCRYCGSEYLYAKIEQREITQIDKTEKDQEPTTG